MTNELSNFIQELGLPRYVRSFDDAVRMGKMFGFKPSLIWSRDHAKKSLSHMDEPVYIYSLYVHCRFTDRQTHSVQDLNRSVVFLTENKFVCIDFDQNKKVEIPLGDIRSVANSIGTSDGIYFRTQELNVDIVFIEKLKNLNLTRDLIIHLAANSTAFSPPTQPAPDAPATRTDATSTTSLPSAKSSVIDCVGCGAAVIIPPDTLGKCEYCDRPAAKPQKVSRPISSPSAAPPIPTPSTNVADELKKYKELLDLGVISQNDFEVAKAKLLGQV